MTSSLAHNMKRAVAGVLALIIVAGALPSAGTGVRLFETAVAASAAEPDHTHNFTYTAGTGDAANSITAKCEDNCPDGFYLPCTLTLNAPEDLTYDGAAKEASVTGNPGHAGEPGQIVYYKSDGEGSTAPSGEALSEAPADVGYYVAQFTWGDATASKAFSITGDLFDSVVTVDTSDKSVSVTINGNSVPPEAYKLIYFTYTKIEGGESLTRVGEEYPTEPGAYIATVTAADGSGYINGNRSDPFCVGTVHDFESMKQAAGWYSFDIDEDGKVWQIVVALMEVEDETAHSGDRVIFSRSWNDDEVYDTDNWAVGPEFEVYENGKLEFWAKCNEYYPENFRVYAIKKSDADFEDFNVEAWTPVSDTISATGEWTKYTCDLSEFGGETIFIAFRHKDTDKDYLMIDDITLPGKESEKKDLFDSTVTVDTDNRSVSVKYGDEVVPEEAYQLNFFSCVETEDGQIYNWIGTEFPTEPGTYMATVSAEIGSEYCNVNRSGLFKIYEDFSKAKVSVDVDNKSVIVIIGNEIIPSDQYSVAYGPNAPQSFDEFPTAPGTYYAYVTANTENSDYMGTAVSAPFTIADPYPIASTRVKLNNVSSDSYGTLTASWTPDENADGYEILLWNSRRMGCRTTVSRFTVDGAESDITIDGLIPGGRYFVKVRAYKLVDGKRVYGKFSSTGSATVKKSYNGFCYSYGYGYGNSFNPLTRSNPWGYGYGYSFGRPYLAANLYRSMRNPYYFFRF